ncbi:uncharacterized protein [Blastocystis hominis]|uniref:Spindle assembly abnormal protein 6 N-terminal domain-containing protein n=1 Tax=Blastocystis hominis TaxID=12968 RepID=D8LYW5_BLAHO|nr:uncharacterized protein [Blastocystis hominis]CBK21004.2 unnamed protein product [Blastocystis hominis]|eukprot:XP_012895052.1 uncharacterized protein [Blastocystis hominis]
MEDSQEPHTDERCSVREMEVTVANEERHLSLKVETVHTEDSDTLQLELSDPSNASFLYYCIIREDEYENMITSQNVLIPFNQFPSHFLSILDRITETKTNRMSSLGGFFTFSICLEPLEEDGSQLLKVVQVSSFMSFPLISLPFRQANDSQLISYLLSLVRLYQDPDSASVSPSSAHSNSLLQRYRDLQRQYSHDTASLKQDYESSLHQIQQTLESQILSLRHQLDTLDQQHAASLDQQRQQWAAQLAALQQKLAASSASLLAAHGERDELRAAFDSLQDEANRLRRTAGEADSCKKSLADLQQAEKALAETAERTAKQLQEQTEKAEKASATLAEREAALEEAKKRQKELETAVKRLEREVEEGREREEGLEREKEEQKKAMETMAVQLAQLKTEHAKNVDYVKTLLHSNKMKDRAISCLNQEINKIKLGSHVASSL